MLMKQAEVLLVESIMILAYITHQTVLIETWTFHMLVIAWFQCKNVRYSPHTKFSNEEVGRCTMHLDLEVLKIIYPRFWPDFDL